MLNLGVGGPLHGRPWGKPARQPLKDGVPERGSLTTGPAETFGSGLLTNCNGGIAAATVAPDDPPFEADAQVTIMNGGAPNLKPKLNEHRRRRSTGTSNRRQATRRSEPLNQPSPSGAGITTPAEAAFGRDAKLLVR